MEQWYKGMNKEDLNIIMWQLDQPDAKEEKEFIKSESIRLGVSEVKIVTMIVEGDYINKAAKTWLDNKQNGI